jgi:hypothetical protein
MACLGRDYAEMIANSNSVPQQIGGRDGYATFISATGVKEWL